MKKILKMIAVATVGSVVVKSADKVSTRPTGTYPTPKRLATVAVAAMVLNYALAATERKLGMTAEEFDN